MNVESHTNFTGDNLDVMRGINSDSSDASYWDPHTTRHTTTPHPPGPCAPTPQQLAGEPDDMDHG